MPAERGFSLLEVVVAFTLMALSVAVLMQAFGGGARLLGDAEQLARAATLAQSQLARVGTEIPLAAREYQGEWPKDLRFKLRVIPVAPSPVLAGQARWQLFYVEVTVSWFEAGRPKTYSLTTLRIGEQTNAAG
nr:general secretion pathway protein I [uncultured Gammaproteobacteria bacterium]